MVHLVKGSLKVGENGRAEGGLGFKIFRNNRSLSPAAAEGSLDGGVNGPVQLREDGVHQGGGVLAKLRSRSREGRAGKQRQTHKLGERFLEEKL